MDPATLEVRRKTLIRAPRDAVYELFASAAGLDSWFTTGAELDARAKGQIIYRWKDWGADRISTEARGTVHRAERPSRFIFDWDSGDLAPTTVEMLFTSNGEGTVMTLREFGFSDTPQGRLAVVREASGWGEAMTLAKFRIEHGVRY
jgi:uncharacterized protein YndB with AHSA1/START domain